MRKITVICGPTAVGKTDYTIKIASALDGEIVNADSMQIYQFMNIGSAKPTKEEREACYHHLVDCIDPREPFSVADYQVMAKAAIEDIFARGKHPVVSGGTGLYVNSLIHEMDFSAAPPDKNIYNARRKALFDLAEGEGKAHVHAILRRLDPEAAERIHPNNLKKVVRAIEICELTGEKNREFAASVVPTKDYEYTLIGLTRDREELYERVNRRVDILVKQGLFEEVRALLDMGLSADDIAMKGIGYKEIIGFFDGAYGREEAIDLIKRNTRHLAKRQWTWFRRYDDIKWFNLSEYTSDVDCMGEILRWIRR